MHDKLEGFENPHIHQVLYRILEGSYEHFMGNFAARELASRFVLCDSALADEITLVAEQALKEEK